MLEPWLLSLPIVVELVTVVAVWFVSVALVLSVVLSVALVESAPVISLPVSVEVAASVAMSRELVVSTAGTPLRAFPTDVPVLVSVWQVVAVLELESDNE